MRGLLVCAALVVWTTPAAAQDHYALELLAPRDDLPTNHRMTRAYPGIAWKIQVAAVGGEWPYTYTLSGAPAAMAIVAGPCTTIALSCDAGTITWPSPDSSDASITIRVTDRDGDFVEETWGVTVGVSGFRWIDASSGNNANNGILVADGGTGPIQTMSAMHGVDTGSSIWVFRSGTYTLAGFTTAGSGDSTRVDYEHDAGGGGNGTMWVCYPGEDCTIDIRYNDVDPAPYIRLVSGLASVEGFTCRRTKIKCVEWAPIDANSIGVFARNTFTEGGPGAEGSNAAYIMTASNSYAFLAQLVIQNSTFGAADHTALKLYSLSKFLFENNVFQSGNAGMDVKSVIAQYHIRSSSFASCTGACITGNMDEQAAQPGVQTQGEVLFNYFNDCGANGCLYYAEQFPRGAGEGFGPLFAYRNTIVGNLTARDVTSDEGNLQLTQNVIINAIAASGDCPAKITCTTVTDYTKIVFTNNLTGVAADNIVNASGDLQGTYLTDHGPNSGTPKGHMLGVTAPSRLRFRIASWLDAAPLLAASLLLLVRIPT